MHASQHWSVYEYCLHFQMTGCRPCAKALKTRHCAFATARADEGNLQILQPSNHKLAFHIFTIAVSVLPEAFYGLRFSGLCAAGTVTLL